MNANEADEASMDVINELCKGDFLNWSPADMAEARRRIAAVLLRRGTREPLALALVEPPQPRDWPADWQEQFWGAYPRRVGKADAMRRLEKIRAAGKVPFEQILNAALVYRTETQNVEMQYIAHPATWINRGRWEDDPGAIAGQRDDGRGEIKNGFLGRFMDRR
jgi:hypothetical protein